MFILDLRTAISIWPQTEKLINKINSDEEELKIKEREREPSETMDERSICLHHSDREQTIRRRTNSARSLRIFLCLSPFNYPEMSHMS